MVYVKITVESFHIKNKKTLGIMWHPERYRKIKNFDLKLLKEFMQLIILSAGKTRLPAKFRNKPKCLVELNSRPLLSYNKKF